MGAITLRQVFRELFKREKDYFWKESTARKQRDGDNSTNHRADSTGANHESKNERRFIRFGIVFPTREKAISLALGVLLIYLTPTYVVPALERLPILKKPIYIAAGIFRPPQGIGRARLVFVDADSRACFTAKDTPTRCDPMDRAYLAQVLRGTATLIQGQVRLAIDMYGWGVPRADDDKLEDFLQEALIERKVTVGTKTVKLGTDARIIMGTGGCDDLRETRFKRFLEKGLLVGFVEVNRSHLNQVSTVFPGPCSDGTTRLSLSAQMARSTLPPEEDSSFEERLGHRATLFQGSPVPRVSAAEVVEFLDLRRKLAEKSKDKEAEWEKWNPCPEESKYWPAETKMRELAPKMQKICTASIVLFGITAPLTPPKYKFAEQNPEKFEVDGKELEGPMVHAEYFQAFTESGLTLIRQDVYHVIEPLTAFVLLLCLGFLEFSLARLMVLIVVFGFAVMASVFLVVVGYIAHSLPYLAAIAIHTVVHEGAESLAKEIAENIRKILT